MKGFLVNLSDLQILKSMMVYCFSYSLRSWKSVSHKRKKYNWNKDERISRVLWKKTNINHYTFLGNNFQYWITTILWHRPHRFLAKILVHHWHILIWNYRIIKKILLPVFLCLTLLPKSEPFQNLTLLKT